jgi:hypothetical protein
MTDTKYYLSLVWILIAVLNGLLYVHLLFTNKVQQETIKIQKDLITLQRLELKK